MDCQPLPVVGRVLTAYLAGLEPDLVFCRTSQGRGQ